MKKKNLFLFVGLSVLALGLASCTPEVTPEPTPEPEPEPAPVVRVTSVTIDNKEDRTLFVGDTVQLTATVLPADAANKKVLWKSNNDDIVSVSDNGLVTAKGRGNASIFAVSEDGSRSDRSYFRIIDKNDDRNPATGISIAGASSYNLTEGDSLKLTATVTPDYASNKTVSWYSTDLEVATVDNDGNVTATGAGDATIKAFTHNGLLATVSVHVEPLIVIYPVTGLNVQPLNTLNVGDMAELSYEVLPENATNKNVTFVSADPEIASVNASGVVTALKDGETYVTVETEDGGFKQMVAVNVEERYNINYAKYEGVTIEGPASARIDSYVEFTVEAANDNVAAVYANDVRCGTNNGAYYFLMPHEDVNVVVVFSEIIPESYDIVNANPEFLTLAGPEAAIEGALVDVKVSVKAGYSMNSVSLYELDGEERLPMKYTFFNSILSFEMPANPVVIDADVVANVYQLSLSGDNYTMINNVNRVDGLNLQKVDGKYFVETDAELRINFYSDASRTDKKTTPVAITLSSGERYEADIETNTVTFKMPAHSTNVNVIADAYLRKFAISESEHISAKAYKLEEGEYVELEENKAVYDDYVYLKLTNSDPDNISLRSLTGSYRKTGASSDTSLTIYNPNSDGYYTFKMPDVMRGTSVNLSIKENNDNKFINEDFVGTYVGVETWSNYIKTTKANAAIKADGAMTYGYSSSARIDSYEDGVLTTEDNARPIGFTDGVLYMHYNLSSDSIFTSDMYIFFKLPDETQASDFNVMGMRFANGYYIAELRRADDNSLVRNIFIDVANESVAVDVTFSMKTGQAVNSVGEVEFSILDKDNNYLGTVVGSNTSSTTNLSFVHYDGYEGAYAGEEEATLTLDGLGHAVYNEVEYAYTIQEENSLRLQKGANVVYVTVDKENHTFTVTGTETLDVSIFDGLVFTGTYYDQWDEYNNSLKITFDEAGADISGVIQCGTYSANYFYFTGSYNEATHKLTITITQSSHSYVSVGSVHTLTAAEGSLTFDANLSSYSLFTVGGATVTCAGFHI